jgi:hypothetical protein
MPEMSERLFGSPTTYPKSIPQHINVLQPTLPPLIQIDFALLIPLSQHVLRIQSLPELKVNANLKLAARDTRTVTRTCRRLFE